MDGAAGAAGASDAGEPGSAAWWVRRWESDARRRPRADGLTTDRIVEAAIALVDGEGLDALTVRRLADRFGTSSASLYRHIASRDELLVLMVDHGLGDVAVGGPPQPGAWRDEASAILASLRDVTLRHPKFVPVALAFPLRGPNALRMADAALAVFLAAGLGPDAATYAVTTCINFVFGAAALQAGGDRPPLVTAPRLAEADRLVAALPPGSIPALREVGSAFVTASPDDAFRHGLGIVLDGVAARYLT